MQTKHAEEIAARYGLDYALDYLAWKYPKHTQTELIVPKLEHPALRSLSEVQAEREQRDLQMKLDNPAGHRFDLYPIWKCPCGALNQYADTFGEICLRCGTDHTLDWQRFICEIGLSSSHLDNPAYSAPIPDGLERICGAFATAKGEACPLPMFHEGDCPIDED